MKGERERERGAKTRGRGSKETQDNVGSGRVKGEAEVGEVAKVAPGEDGTRQGKRRRDVGGGALVSHFPNKEQKNELYKRCATILLFYFVITLDRNVIGISKTRT